jgi:signal transduction histidine kinase
VEDYDTWPGHFRDGTGLVQAMAGVPLRSGDKVVGVIALASDRDSGRTFSEEEVELLDRFAQLASIALDNARLFEETQQRLRELAAINSIGQALASQLEVSAVIDLVGEKLRELFGAQNIYVALHDPQTNLIHFPYYWEVDHREISEEPLIFGQGLTSRILESRQPQLINSDLERRAIELGVVALDGVMPKSSLGVPITVGERVIGVIMLQSAERENLFTDADLRLLTTIAAAVGVALENARLFAEAQQAKEAAEAANESKSVFLANVSHELRTPLTSVLGFAKIIQKRLEERILPVVQVQDRKTQRAVEQVRENLGIIVAEGERLTALINDVLDLAKIEAGRVEWRMRPLGIRDVVERALAATAPLFEQKGLNLTRDLPDSLPQVVGDQAQLIRVVINLLSNAVKFTDQGGVTCRARLADGGLVVSVIDTGQGIPAADQPRVFEKFVQAGDTLISKPQGTGLGLTICRQIVEQHGGRIWVESQPGRGSTFSFSLPVPGAPPVLAREVNP